MFIKWTTQNIGGPIQTAIKVTHNKADIIIWDQEKKICTIVGGSKLPHSKRKYF